eukprot:s2614_g3.t1
MFYMTSCAIDDELGDELREIQRIICIRLWASTPLVHAGIAARTRVGQPRTRTVWGEWQMLQDAFRRLFHTFPIVFKALQDSQNRAEAL